MKRLVRKEKQLSKTAALITTNFDYFILNSGDVVGIGSRVVNNKPRFQVYQEGAYTVSSFYDGDDYEAAVRMYKDLLLAFKGVGSSEQFGKSEVTIKKRIDDMLEEKKDDDYNFQKLKSSPLFLGVNEY